MPKIIIPGKQSEIVKTENGYKRFVVEGDRQVEVRIMPPSKEAIKSLGMRSNRYILSPISINPLYIEKKIAIDKAKIMRSIAIMNSLQRQEYLKKNTPIDFWPHKGYFKYKITCGKCGDEIAIVWSKDSTIKDWCDLHYLTKFDSRSWYGCVAVNVSPIDDQLGFNCACGEDTRDYRANKSLPPIMKGLMMDYVKERRGFGHSKAAFLVEKQ